MHIEGPGKRVTIHLSESDRHGHALLYEAVVELLREQGCAGATVVKGTMGFGKASRIHTSSILRLSEDLPVMVIFADTAERVEAVMPLVEQMLSGGIVIVEDVQIARYSHGPSEA